MAPRTGSQRLQALWRTRSYVRPYRAQAIYGPTIKLLGNTTIAVVLLYGGQRVLDHQMTIGVLAAYP